MDRGSRNRNPAGFGVASPSTSHVFVGLNSIITPPLLLQEMALKDLEQFRAWSATYANSSPEVTRHLAKVTSTVDHASNRVDTLFKAWEMAFLSATNIVASPSSEVRRESIASPVEGTRPVDTPDSDTANRSSIATPSPVATGSVSQVTFSNALGTFDIFSYAPAFPPVKSSITLEIDLKQASIMILFFFKHLQALVEWVFHFVEEYWREILILTLWMSVMMLWQCNSVLWAEVVGLGRVVELHDKRITNLTALISSRKTLW